jgi:hypothetical protein
MVFNFIFEEVLLLVRHNLLEEEQGAILPLREMDLLKTETKLEVLKF